MESSWNDPCHAVIEIENRDCKVLAMLRPAGITQFKVTDIRGSSTGAVKHLVELPMDQTKKITKDMQVRTLTSNGPREKSTSWIESEGCRVCSTILSQSTFLISGRSITDSTIAYSFIAPSFSAYRRIVSALEKSKFKVKVLRVGKFESKTNVLTEKQQRILWIALQTGYFDYPKRVDSKELSSRLGSAPQHSQRSPEEEQEGFWNTISKGDHDTTRGVYMINRFIYILCK